MEKARANRRGLRAVGISAALVVVAVAAVLMQSRGATAAGGAPPDGRYEKVIVEGRAVPMVAVMEGGAVVLVDTDGAKPRTWEEQFKRKGSLPAGQYNVHKTHVTREDGFASDPVDREGLWVIDDKGNIVAR